MSESERITEVIEQEHSLSIPPQHSLVSLIFEMCHGSLRSNFQLPVITVPILDSTLLQRF